MDDIELDKFLDSLKSGFPMFGSHSSISLDSPAVDGDYPIHYAVIQNNESIVRKMIKRGVDMNLLGEDGFTPLDYAKLHDHEKLADYLESIGGKLNQMNDA